MRVLLFPTVRGEDAARKLATADPCHRKRKNVPRAIPVVFIRRAYLATIVEGKRSLRRIEPRTREHPRGRLSSLTRHKRPIISVRCRGSCSIRCFPNGPVVFPNRRGYLIHEPVKVRISMTRGKRGVINDRRLTIQTRASWKRVRLRRGGKVAKIIVGNHRRFLLPERSPGRAWITSDTSVNGRPINFPFFPSPSAMYPIEEGRGGGRSCLPLKRVAVRFHDGILGSGLTVEADKPLDFSSFISPREAALAPRCLADYFPSVLGGN